MSFDKQADERIREAIERGEFDDLPGKGKPLDLEAYFATPEHLRIGYSILKNAEIIPAEMELLKEIGALRKCLESADDRTDEAVIRKRLSEKVASFNLRMEQFRKNSKSQSR